MKTKKKFIVSAFALFMLMIVPFSCASAEADSDYSYNSPLILNEIMPANNADTYKHSFGKGDWVEIKNISADSISLSSYYLSDDKNDLKKYQLSGNLPAGNLRLVFCDTEGRTDNLPCAPFGLNLDETLYLTDGSTVLDAVPLRDVPPNGSIGRLNGKVGFFYFSEPTPYSKNSGGKRHVSSSPRSDNAGGVFDNTDEILVSLEAEGEIYYTLDGSRPSAKSEHYTHPLSITSTCVLRAIALEEDSLESQPLNLSFIMNEGHTLPVLSLMSDNYQSFHRMHHSGDDTTEVAGALSFFDEKGYFTAPCGISLGGAYSLQLDKKTFNIHFRSSYGPKNVKYDIFGTGEEKYSSLVIRSGQDNHSMIFRTELWQDIGFEMAPDLLSQKSRFCVLYVNGEYYGLVCLKEDFSRSYYASHRNVSDKDTCELANVGTHTTTNIFDEVLAYAYNNDMSDPEKYQEFCSMFSVKAFIDWSILQGVSGNIDLKHNVRYMCSYELGHQWEVVFYDLDHALHDKDSAWTGIFGTSWYPSEGTTRLLRHLLRNEEFRDQFLKRYAEVYDTVLSNENILSRMDYYEKLLSPEVERDWLRWGYKPQKWGELLDTMRDMIVKTDWQEKAVNAFFTLSRLPVELKDKYF